MSIAPKIFFKIPLAKHGKENTMYMRFYFYLEILRVFHYELGDTPRVAAGFLK